MRRGLPHRELIFLSKWYEDYMVAKYGVPRDSEHPSEEEIIASAAWDAETITGGGVKGSV